MVVSIEMWPNFEWKMRSSDNEIDFFDVDVVVISGHGVCDEIGFATSGVTSGGACIFNFWIGVMSELGKVDFNDALLSDRTLKEATGLDDCIGNVIIPLLVRDRSICCFPRFM